MLIEPDEDEEWKWKRDQKTWEIHVLKDHAQDYVTHHCPSLGRPIRISTASRDSSCYDKQLKHPSTLNRPMKLQCGIMLRTHSVFKSLKKYHDIIA